MEIILSILIPITESRIEVFKSLKKKLLHQAFHIPDIVEILCDWDENNNVGKKRNDLLKRAKGKYVVFVDSDDDISSDYISKILTACESGADCIGISGVITTNGRDERQWHISKEYGSWYERDGVYYRTPNHISPVKRELALQAGFPEIAFAEDFGYSMRLLPLLKTETIVEGNIYHYDYWEK